MARQQRPARKIREPGRGLRRVPGHLVGDACPAHVRMRVVLAQSRAYGIVECGGRQPVRGRDALPLRSRGRRGRRRVIGSASCSAIVETSASSGESASRASSRAASSGLLVFEAGLVAQRACARESCPSRPTPGAAVPPTGITVDGERETRGPPGIAHVTRGAGHGMCCALYHVVPPRQRPTSRELSPRPTQRRHAQPDPGRSGLA